MAARLSLLWASDGSEYCLSTAGSLRQVLFPSAAKLGIVSVAPLREKRAAVMRFLGMGEEVRRDEEAKAQAAVQASIEALGEVAFPIQQAVRWGPTPQEVRREATRIQADVIIAGAKPFNAFRRMIMDDTALEILRATYRTMLLARPAPNDSLTTMVVYCSSPRWLSRATDFVGRLGLGGQVKVYLAAFREPPAMSSGLFITYTEYRRFHSESGSFIDHQMMRSVLSEGEDALKHHGYETEIVLADGSADAGLPRLVDDVGAGLLVVGASPYATEFFSSTADALDASLRVSCSVLVAR